MGDDYEYNSIMTEMVNDMQFAIDEKFLCLINSLKMSNSCELLNPIDEIPEY